MKLGTSPEDLAIAAIDGERETWANDAQRHGERIRAHAVITDHFVATPAALRTHVAVSLLEAAADVLVKATDATRAIARLGALARRYGGELPAPKAQTRRAAEALFRKQKRERR